MNRHGKKKGRRLLSILLVLSVLLSVNGITVFAEAVSENEILTEENMVDIGEKEADALREADSPSVSGNAERDNPANPVHNCTLDKPDATTWSYVYFGSYPQSEVIDAATQKAIDEAITVSGNSADAGMDVWVNGTKYRRISKADTNNSGNFDDVENNGYRYFKWERIKWKVLKNDGNTLFVVADKAIDCKDYNEYYEGITWETSTIRDWLSNRFYDIAFSSNEQSAIVPQNVVNEDNPNWGTEGGNNTNDKVYLLSIGEVMNGAYGFCSDGDTKSMSRRIKISDYADARGTWRSSGSGYEGNCRWWLRLLGSNSIYAAEVDSRGCVSQTSGGSVTSAYIGVCPALHIALSSDVWFMADDGISGEGGNPANPVHNCNRNDYDATTWSYVYFGSYPQSEVSDVATQKAINEAITVSGNSADAGMDVWVNGTKYRRINKADTYNNGNFDDMANNGYRYFKWERIKWKVLKNDGNTLFVVADKAIDCKAYNEEYIDITWEDSTIRNWLNNSFYGTAFSSNEQSAIVPQYVVNEDNPECGTEGGNDTNDKVYLLSINEVINKAYGFCSDDSTYSMSRRMKASDYGNARCIRRSSESGYEGNCWWWLRSPGIISNAAAHVGYTGYVSQGGTSVNSTDDGICPALHINLSSAFWFTVDDGTSGEGGSDGGGREEEILKDLQASKAKTEYVQGEELNLDDLTVTAVYGNSSKVLPAGAYTTNAADIDMNTPGSHTLEISYTENSITKKASIKITVREKTGGNPQNQQVKVTKLTITVPSKQLAAGQKVKFSLKVEPENATNKTVTWKTNNAKCATVDKNGKVALKAAGAGKTVTITATANDGSGQKAMVKLKIMKHTVKSIKLKAQEKTLKAGKSMTVKATVKTTGKSANKTLKWTSSNTRYATVNKSGKVTAKKAGKGKTVTITAASTDGSNKKATIKIKIK